MLAALARTQEPSGPRWIVDPTNAKAAKLRADQAKLGLASWHGKQCLQITTEATAPWPGVFIEPLAGRWDLSGYDAIEIDVRNPQDVPVRILLEINAPGADGRHRCNVESITVAPHDAAALVVPFGTWHGELHHPIDLKDIVSLHVLLDRAGRSHRFIIGDIRAIHFDRSQMEEVFSDPFFQTLTPVFGRGINLGDALEAPEEGQWGVVLKEEYFQQIKSAGFDSVRIPVRWSAHAETTAPYRIDPKFFQRVDWAVEQALRRRLTPVVNIHHYEGIMKQPDEHHERFLALWEQIAEHYRDYPAELALELLNEPEGKLTAEKWNQLAAKAIAVIRRTNSVRDIVVGPVGWNSIRELSSLQLPPNDPHLIVTVHYYHPFHFTHQGAEWVGPDSQKWLGTTWMADKTERQAIVRDLDAAITWAVRHHRRLYLGEFGAYKKADLASRARWTRFVAEEAVQRKMGFAYWEFCAGFGAYDPVRNVWIEPLRDALLGR